jgi:hypothetical protein
MSVNLNIYVGPYINILSRTKDVEVEFNVCSNVFCYKNAEEEPIDGKFCGECGSPTVKAKQTHSGTFDLGKMMMDELGDWDFLISVNSYGSNETAFLVGNHERQGGKQLKMNDGVPQAFDFLATAENLSFDESDWFKASEMLVKHKIQHEMCYGTVSWWS